ncbi:MAG: hypothetical protein CVT61_08830 [Actinobacteria bacterium HGW-Actinobacteria-11]|nr:MAG: hypothetical protein CVT61_08830 [Actinobacteria bacterium HGW-Actinobacteria-11]
MVIGRERPLAAAMDLLLAGVSVDIVGGRGSGRSTFLRALASRLEDREWTVVRARGIASLRQHSLGALHLAGFGTATGARPATLNETARALAERLRARTGVLLVDDWDDLDESSWGVVEYVRRDAGVPVVISRLQGLRARHTPTGLPASTLEPAYVIDIEPLRFDEMESVLREHLDAPVEAGTMSRLFAKSGGNVGLLLTLVDASIREQRMSRRSTGEWEASRDLWSGALRAVLEAHLEGFEDHTRDALEIIAVVGVADLETVRKLVPWEILELLEERGTIAIVPSAGRRLVTVVPPLLVEYFRHEPLATRRTRLIELVEDKLGAGLGEQESEPDEPRRSISSVDDALFVRLLQERARTLRLVTAAEWAVNPSPAAAVRYATALMHVSTETVRSTVEGIIDTVDPSLGDGASLAEFVVLRAQWRAYVAGELDEAIAQLRRDAADLSLGPYRRLLDAAQVRLLVNLREVPQDFTSKLEVEDDLPGPVKITLWETQMLVLVCLGRFDDARRVFAEVSTLDDGHASHLSRALMGLALLGAGRHWEGMDFLGRGFDEAHGYLDVDALRTFGAALALGHMLAGDYTAADDVLETLHSAGDPAVYPPGIPLALLSISAVINIRRGKVSAGERFAAEIEKLEYPDGPLPGQSRAWPRAQLLAFEGDLTRAGEVLWSSGTDLWNRNARYAGVTELLSSLELVPAVERLADVRQKLRDLPDARSLAAYADFVAAGVAGDPAAMLASVDVLEDRGLAGLALSACKLAATAFAKAADPEREAAARAREERLRTDLAGRQIDTARFAATATALTEREKEVGRLAAEGLTNPEIAIRLVLSVRTVESHIHRLLRKLDLQGRQGLSNHLEALR